jgi:hypothetical protein
MTLTPITSRPQHHRRRSPPRGRGVKGSVGHFQSSSRPTGHQIRSPRSPLPPAASPTAAQPRPLAAKASMAMRRSAPQTTRPQIRLASHYARARQAPPPVERRHVDPAPTPCMQWHEKRNPPPLRASRSLQGAHVSGGEDGGLGKDGPRAVAARILPETTGEEDDAGLFHPNQHRHIPSVHNYSTFLV